MNRFQAGWRGGYLYPTVEEFVGLASRGPFIARIGGNPGHFVIVDRVVAGNVLIRDPADGAASCAALSDFLNSVSGVVFR
jgi:hypothetical protein